MNDIISSMSTIKNFMASASRTTCNEYLYNALQDALSAMEMFSSGEMQELQQYRAIGTLDEFRSLTKKNKPIKPAVLTSDHDVKIGNVTFRKGTKIYKCICGSWIGRICKYCPDCGQAIDWGEELNAAI